MPRLYTLLMLLASQLLWATPPNDMCMNAIHLSIGNCQTFDITDATASDNPTPILDCGSNSILNDIWFSINAPASGNLTIDINEIAGGVSDMAMELYSGSCANLIPVACNRSHPLGDYQMPYIELENLNTGQYFLRVVSENNINTGMFSLCTSDQGYTQYSCRIDLILAKTQSACDPATNSYSQDLEVYYRDDGNSVGLTGSYGDYPLSGNPSTITLNNLPANGGPVHVGMQIERSPQDDCFTNSYYLFRNAFTAAQNCFSGSVPNDECAGAIALPVTTACTETIFNNIGATNSMKYACGFNPDGLQDVWFSVVVPASGELVVNTWWTSQLIPVVAVFEGVCGNLNEISCGDYANNPRISNRTPGETLYFRVMDSNAEYQDEFAVCVIDPGALTNESCATSLQISNSQACDGSIIYSSDGAISDGFPTPQISCNTTSSKGDLWFHFVVPSSGTLNVSVTQSTESDPIFIPHYVELYEGNCNGLSSIYCGLSYNSIPILQNRIPGEIIYMRIEDENDYITKPFQICLPSADNDICQDAIPLTVGNCLITSNEDATPSNQPTPSLSCGETLANDLDVWYSVIVPASGNLTIQTLPVSNTFFTFSISVEAYSGACTNLIPIACSYYTERWNTNDGHALLELENLTPNSTIYLRAADQGSILNFDEFSICVTDSGYSNHACKIQYIEAGKANACDPVTNTFSQEITVYYYDDGTSEFLEINNVGSFPLTPSPMTVVVPDLDANGNQADIEAFLSGQMYNECFVNSQYFKNHFFDSVSNCFGGTIPNDHCINAIELIPSEIDCETSIYDFTGATSSMPSFGCGSAQANPQDLWFKVTVPASGEIILAVESNSTNPLFEIYEGSCANLNRIHDCGSVSFSARIANRIPGEILFIRTTYRINNTQGDFGICVMDPQPNGEVCQDAVSLPISSECFPTTIYSTHFSTAENFPTNNLSCSQSSASSKDIWFSVTIPSTGELSIMLYNITDSRVEAELFESSCTTLNSIDCQSDFLPEKEFSISGRSPGEVLLLRVSATESFRNTTFTICATSTCPDTEIISYPITGLAEFEDHISITADNLIENTANVIYDAGQCILLQSGFEVQLNGIFHAYIDGCN